MSEQWRVGDSKPPLYAWAGQIVAPHKGGGEFVLATFNQNYPEIAKEAAQRAVRAVNCHADLLAACESFVSAYPMGINKDLDEAYRAARAAIAKAKGGDQ